MSHVSDLGPLGLLIFCLWNTYIYIHYRHKYLPCILTPLSFWAAGFECSEATILTAPAMGWTHDMGVSENVGPPGWICVNCWAMLDVSTVDGLYDWTSKHSCRGLLCGHWQQHIYSSLQLKIYETQNPGAILFWGSSRIKNQEEIPIVPGQMWGCFLDIWGASFAKLIALTARSASWEIHYQWRSMKVYWKKTSMKWWVFQCYVWIPEDTINLWNHFIWILFGAMTCMIGEGIIEGSLGTVRSVNFDDCSKGDALCPKVSMSLKSIATFTPTNDPVV